MLLIKVSVSVLKKYKDVESVVKMEEVNGEELVKRFAEEMEEMLGRKMKSVKVSIHSAKTETKTTLHGRKLCFSHHRLNHISVMLDLITLPTGAATVCKHSVFLPCCVLSQRLAEAAEDADLYHEYNETLEVCIVHYKSTALCDTCVCNH